MRGENRREITGSLLGASAEILIWHYHQCVFAEVMGERYSDEVMSVKMKNVSYGMTQQSLSQLLLNLAAQAVKVSQL